MIDDTTEVDGSKLSAVGRKRWRDEGSSGESTGGGKLLLTSKVFCTSFDSRIGRLYVASTERGVCKISVPKENRKDFIDWLKEHFDAEQVTDNRARNRDVIDQLTRYFNGKLAKFTCPIDLVGTPFQIRVWKELMKIPYGSTITYKHLARRVSAPHATQAVGRANGANPLPIIIPCHRVLGSNGALVGYSCGVKTKEFLLRLEGAIML
jgi:methylated-DNA-[protein]-cysteine S-methyltransferase